MKKFKTKIIILLSIAVCISFFSNDFGLIDIENTAIITALAIDKSDNVYEVTAQIAVPEANNTQTENQCTTVSGKGKTIGAAIKDIGNKAGWFPKLSFCNLIAIGNEIAKENTVKVLDYFSKTLRIQDSAVLVLAENTAKDLITSTTPLDNISSFALQKTLLKNQGFDKDVATISVKDFVSGYYSPFSSSYMPLVKINPIENSSENNKNSTGIGGAENTEEKKSYVSYDSTTTAIFKNGIKVGEMDKDLTAVFNLINTSASQTTFSISDVNLNGKISDCLITVLKNQSKIYLTVTNEEFIFNIGVTVFCKISDDSSGSSDYSFSEDLPLPQAVKDKTEKFLTENILRLISLEKDTRCDFLSLGENLYRYHNGYYFQYKNTFLQKMNSVISVTVEGQK